MNCLIHSKTTNIKNSNKFKWRAHLGGNKNQREKYKGHKYYQDTVNFCENWDQKSFDPNYKSLPLKEFEPLVKKIFSRKPYSN